MLRLTFSLVLDGIRSALSSTDCESIYSGASYCCGSKCFNGAVRKPQFVDIKLMISDRACQINLRKLINLPNVGRCASIAAHYFISARRKTPFSVYIHVSERAPVVFVATNALLCIQCKLTDELDSLLDGSSSPFPLSTNK